MEVLWLNTDGFLRRGRSTYMHHNIHVLCLSTYDVLYHFKTLPLTRYSHLAYYQSLLLNKTFFMFLLQKLYAFTSCFMKHFPHLHLLESTNHHLKTVGLVLDTGIIRGFRWSPWKNGWVDSYDDMEQRSMLYVWDIRLQQGLARVWFAKCLPILFSVPFRHPIKLNFPMSLAIRQNHIGVSWPMEWEWNVYHIPVSSIQINSASGSCSTPVSWLPDSAKGDFGSYVLQIRWSVYFPEWLWKAVLPTSCWLYFM